MADQPLAYHLTFGTYGTRLHGDDRGTVHRSMNQPGDPIIGRNEDWEQVERRMLKFPPVILTSQQRVEIERVIPVVCARGGWMFCNCAAQSDHVHTLLRGSADGKAIRRWLKTWVSQAITERWPLVPGAVWWAECGSVKWVWTDDYLANVYEYIEGQRTTRRG